MRVHLINCRERRGIEIGAARGDANPVFLTRREMGGWNLHGKDAAAASEEFWRGTLLRSQLCAGRVTSAVGIQVQGGGMVSGNITNSSGEFRDVGVGRLRPLDRKSVV